MEEVTGLVASQVEHHQLVAHFEAQLVSEREASRRLGEQLTLTQDLFSHGHPAVPTIDYFLSV